MRVFYDDRISQPDRDRDASHSAFVNSNVSFTGDAITHLAKNMKRFNITEWIWHIEIINGKEWYIVTDKKA
ncbi:hypothetical protein A8C56_01640 [Niabella ginsenosidivorans]|uniref:Uncharacterized protein n=1 Tax=Niabella ginsenosidivorans TaxID=1176587 RepID=A0A1A9HWT8_9BACT|nr:hypothetical protein [Niabella ginsenosidivorans]ANH79847.1 hypothetical protein A8C56_01640 [Niabella ginsenosidivorans]